MSENGDRPRLRVFEGGRSVAGSSAGSRVSPEEQLAALIAQGVRASGHEGELADELARSYLRQTRESAPKPPPTLTDPIERRSDRIEGDRGGPARSADSLFSSLLGSLRQPSPGPEASALPSPSPSGPSRPLTPAGESHQAHARNRRGSHPRQRSKRPEKRRGRREEHSKKRLAKLREDLFEGQTPDIPDIPELKPEVRATNLAIVRDGTGRKAREVMAQLPIGQQLAVYAAAYAAAPKVRRGLSHMVTRAEVAEATLPEAKEALEEALRVVREDVAPSMWFRRLVCCAWALWGHRHKLGEAARKAGRGGIFTVQGFCERALAWLVPKPDGTLWSRSALFRENGPFPLLGTASRRLGRNVPGEVGIGLWTRWQPPYAVALFKGPWRTNPRTGQRERFALAQHRYDAEMSGRTAASLARRGRGALRELARTLVAVMTPWIELPAPRKRSAPARGAVDAGAPRGAHEPAAAVDARGPP